MTCVQCPRGAGPCHGESFPRLCQLIDPAHSAYNPHYRAALVTHPAPEDPEAARPAIEETIRQLGVVKRCPYRSVDAGCGCSGARCALRGHAVVSHLDCLDCVRVFG